ncbi:hypothetical protein CTI12_AA146110 [Artemisia annua]|uniref:Uncharacterized protein n=1 Tax=Artemisia annua TaxID=35608 RepID=A0A2U1PJD9_ARTAN|nr:hypothetical protein CTI12_AA146110 [Artemisia annua]
MHLDTPEDAMPWVGLYVCAASLVCTLAMAADTFQGFRQGKLWFPCRFFSLNAASITVIAIAMKLPVDLTTIKPNNNDIESKSGDVNVKVSSIYFLIIMLANFLPSLGLMNDKELLFNIIALGILIITIYVNICIEIATKVFYLDGNLFMLPILATFSVALTVPASRRILEHQYKELHILPSSYQVINFSYRELVHDVQKYWMIVETGNPQFVIACSQVSSAIGVICLFISFCSSGTLVTQFIRPSYFSYGQSDYKWSIKVIINVQLIGVLVGSIAPAFRCLSAISYFDLSKTRNVNHLNMFRVEERWTQRLQEWKHSQIHIPGRHCQIVLHIFKNMILNFSIALQIMVVVICKIVCIVPKSFLILFCYCWYLLKRYRNEVSVSNNDVKSEIEYYAKYVLQIEDDAKLSERVLRKSLKSFTQLLTKYEKNESSNLMKLLEKSKGFKGVVEFDNDEVPLLHSEETENPWSLVVVTLTAIVVALPNTAKNYAEGLLASTREGLQIIRNIEECLHATSDLVKARKAARCVWTQVEVYHKWLHIDLQKKARNGKTSKEILQWLGDESIKTVIELKSCKKRSIDDSLHKFIVASSMYRISQTTLLHCNEQENWPDDGELCDWMSTVIADILCACFTNLPRVIKMTCHHDAIEKREESVWSAAQLLGKSKKILEILEARQLPNLDVDSMAYIDNWHALPKSVIPNGCTSVNQVLPASSSPNEPVIVNIGV